MRRTLRFLMTILILAGAVPAHSWQTVGVRWNPDANPWAKSQLWQSYIWSEGWSEKEQFFPKYMRPAGSIHLVLRNDSKSADTIELTHVDGIPIQDVVTKPDRASRVIWYRVESPKLGPPKPVTRADEEWKIVEPAKVEPGGWAECSIRFRTVPTKPVKLTFRSGSGSDISVTVPVKPSRTRIECIAFSPKIDRIYVYLRALDGGTIPQGSLFLDGRFVISSWTPGPKPGDLMLAEAKLSPHWEYGSHHLIEVDLFGVARLAQPVRAWDSFFSIGLFGTINAERVKAAKEHGINTYFSAGVSPILNEAGLNVVPSHNVGEGRPRTADQSGVLFYYNMDEPDAGDFHTGSDLPVMDRLGCNAMETVLPTIRYQRERDARTPNLVLVDNTFKPLNYYVYGQTPDVLSTDPYVPLNGRQLDYVPFAVDVARDACAPRPLVSILWACGLSGEARRLGERPPTAEEERMMVFYALGSGAKGIGYFADITSETGEGRFVGLSDLGPVWEEVRRTNSDVGGLAPYLSIGCPMTPPRQTGKVWWRALLCGRDNVVLIAVNQDHLIGFETKYEYAWHTPAKDVRITVPLPPHFTPSRVQEVKRGALTPFRADIKGGTAELRLDSVDTARAFLISR